MAQVAMKTTSTAASANPFRVDNPALVGPKPQGALRDPGLCYSTPSGSAAPPGRGSEGCQRRHDGQGRGKKPQGAPERIVPKLDLALAVGHGQGFAVVG